MTDHNWIEMHFKEFRVRNAISQTPPSSVWFLQWASAFATHLKQLPNSREKTDDFVKNKTQFLHQEFCELSKDIPTSQKFQFLVTYFFTHKNFQSKSSLQYTEEDFSVNRALQTRTAHPLLITGLLKTLAELIHAPIHIFMIETEIYARRANSTQDDYICINRKGKPIKLEQIIAKLNETKNPILYQLTNQDITRSILLDLRGYYRHQGSLDSLLLILESLHQLEGLHIESLVERAIIYKQLGKMDLLKKEIRRILLLTGEDSVSQTHSSLSPTLGKFLTENLKHLQIVKDDSQGRIPISPLII